MRILITGICGFMGHHFAEHLIKTTDWEIVGLDNLTYASAGFDRLRDINVYDNRRIKVFAADITREIKDGLLYEIGKIDYLVHLAAETHVDRSIVDPLPFLMTNVIGTMHILNLARNLNVRKMIYFSTDEVFGPALANNRFAEWSRYRSSNPYAASKAGGEELCLAYANTYKTPVIITHTMNLVGERQHPEKFIPSTVRKIILGETVLIHSNATRTKAGSRFYIHCRNAADALTFLLDRGDVGDKYNIVGEREIDNLELANEIAHIIGKPLIYEMVDFHSSRPGHDLRYAIDGGKIAAMGWKVPVPFEESFEKTIRWMIAPENRRWLGL